MKNIIRSSAFAVVLFLSAAAFGASSYEHCRCNQTSTGLGPGEGSICCGDADNNLFKTNNPASCCNITGKSWVNGVCKTPCSCPAGQTQINNYVEDGTCCKAGTAQWTWVVTNSNMYSSTDSNAAGNYITNMAIDQNTRPCNNSNKSQAPDASQCTSSSIGQYCNVYVVTMDYNSLDFSSYAWNPPTGTPIGVGATCVPGDLAYNKNNLCCQLYMDNQNYSGAASETKANCKSLVSVLAPLTPGTQSCTCCSSTLTCYVVFTYKVEQRKYTCTL